MKLEKAIEILNDCTVGALLGVSKDTKDACKLGSEALKERKIWKDNEGFDPTEALPGETED